MHIVSGVEQLTQLEVVDSCGDGSEIPSERKVLGEFVRRGHFQTTSEFQLSRPLYMVVVREVLHASDAVIFPRY